MQQQTVKAYLQFGKPPGPFQTVEVTVCETPAPRKGQTVAGYGKALPPGYMVKHAGRWYRVKVAQFSNAGSAFIGKPGQWLAKVDLYPTKAVR